MKTPLIAFAAFAFAVLAAQPADAKIKLKCACEKNYKSELEDFSNSDVKKLECAEKYEGFDSSVSVQESYLKVYVDSKNAKQGDLDMNIRLRPRKGDNCLWVATDEHRNKDVWGGTYCNTDSYKDTGQYELRESSGIWTAEYSAQTTSKSYGGVVMFVTNPKDSSDRTLYMNALCIENK